MLLPSSLTHSNREGFEVRMGFEVRGVAGGALTISSVNIH